MNDVVGVINVDSDGTAAKPTSDIDSFNASSTLSYIYIHIFFLSKNICLLLSVIFQSFSNMTLDGFEHKCVEVPTADWLHVRHVLLVATHNKICWLSVFIILDIPGGREISAILLIVVGDG